MNYHVFLYLSFTVEFIPTNIACQVMLFQGIQTDPFKADSSNVLFHSLHPREIHSTIMACCLTPILCMSMSIFSNCFMSRAMCIFILEAFMNPSLHSSHRAEGTDTSSNVSLVMYCGLSQTPSAQPHDLIASLLDLWKICHMVY